MTRNPSRPALVLTAALLALAINTTAFAADSNESKLPTNAVEARDAFQTSLREFAAWPPATSESLFLEWFPWMETDRTSLAPQSAFGLSQVTDLMKSLVTALALGHRNGRSVREGIDLVELTFHQLTLALPPGITHADLHIQLITELTNYETLNEWKQQNLSFDQSDLVFAAESIFRAWQIPTNRRRPSVGRMAALEDEVKFLAQQVETLETAYARSGGVPELLARAQFLKSKLDAMAKPEPELTTRSDDWAHLTHHSLRYLNEFDKLTEICASALLSER